MAIQFPRYRMRDGQTRLAEGYFNPIWQDLDARLHRIEALRVEWEGAVAELSQFGVERLDAVVAPLVAQANAQLAQAQAVGEQLVALVDDLDWTAYLAAELAVHSAAVQGWVGVVAAELNATGARLDGVETRLDRTAPPNGLEITYGAGGQITAMTEQTPLGVRTTALGYDAETGRLNTVTATLAGWTRVETLHYDGDGDGRIDAVTVEEVPA